MLLYTIHGVIERRVLLNYRIEASSLQKVLPAPFRPKLYRGHGVGGICMIRFSGLRPKHVPAWMGMGSENAAHRFAVEWEQEGQLREGVYIPRRETDSWFNQLMGGRVFPGIHERSRFETQESESALSIRVTGAGDGTEIVFKGRVADSLPSTSMFPTMEEASTFFQGGAIGYSATHNDGHYHGVELKPKNWKIEPMAIDEARSNYFSDTGRFPPGTVELDCALLMRNIEHEWEGRPDLRS